MSKQAVRVITGGAILVLAVVGLGVGLSHRAAPVPSSTAGMLDTISKQLLESAQQAAGRQQWTTARAAYLQIVQEHPQTPAAVQAQQQLGDVNMHLLLTPSPDTKAPFYAPYTVQLGDTLGRIARQHHTMIELLQQANHLTGDKILVGRTLNVPTATFSVVVNKSQNHLLLKANEEVLKIYTVSTGKNDQTPVGTFTIVNKIINPPWYTAQGVIPPDSPQNILGTRWLGFSKPSYGIHGTTDPSTIGQSVTAGCVRMRNSEVEELYTLLPIGTDVTIVE